MAVDNRSLEDRLRRIVPKAHIVRVRHLRKAISVCRDQGVRLSTNAHLPHWLDCELIRMYGLFNLEIQNQANQIVLEHNKSNPHGFDRTDLLFLSEPNDRGLDHHTESQVLLHYWKLLYGAKLVKAIQGLPKEEVERRWNGLPDAVRVEATFVLLREHSVPYDPTPTELFVAFTHRLLVDWRFQRSAVHYVFPSIHDVDHFVHDLIQGIDESRIYHSTGVEGAPNPPELAILHHSNRENLSAVNLTDDGSCVKRAEAATKCRHHARAAMILVQGGHKAEAIATLKSGMLQRIASVLNWNDETLNTWAEALTPVLNLTVCGRWSPAAKMLYAFQRLASDLERDIYAIDPARWFRSLTRKSMVRKLELQRITIKLDRLRTAQRKLAHTPLQSHNYERLTELFEAEIHKADTELRVQATPIINGVFDRVGIVPNGPMERIARDKLVAELLDVASMDGFIRIADLRDAMARNRIKLDDLQPRELIGGDAILRADSLLAEELDGIYRRGEVYLRVFQRLSSVSFGTKPGRFFTLFLAIPFIAAFMCVAFGQYLEHEGKTIYGAIRKLVTHEDPGNNIPWDVVDNAEGGVDLVEHTEKAIKFTDTAWISIGILFTVFLLLIHMIHFRRSAFRLIRMLFRIIRVALYELPSTIWNAGVFQALRRHWITRLLINQCFWPVVLAGIVALFFYFFGASATRIERFALCTFAFNFLALLTPLGRQIQDELEEMLSDSFRLVRTALIPGILSWIFWGFRELLGLFDILLYTVDEWFRYRQGESKPSLILKITLSLIWFPIAYVTRFALYLLIEPQINPLKHFPTVTVSHKLLLPMIPSVAAGTGLSIQLVGTVFTGIPGIFGFLVWELKENWRLYKSNKPLYLPAIKLGHHGETMLGLLRPGFHSGTVPRAYRKIRKVIDVAVSYNEPAIVGKLTDTIHHVEHAIHLFVEREIIPALMVFPEWQAAKPECGEVHVGVQSVSFTITSHLGAPASVLFLHRRTGIVGKVVDLGFVAEMFANAREVWDKTMSATMCMAAVSDSKIGWDEWVQRGPCS